MPNTIKFNPGASLDFISNMGRRAAAAAGTRSKQDIAQTQASRLQVTPQDLGNVANRLNIQAQAVKSIQQRFFDLFV